MRYAAGCCSFFCLLLLCCKTFFSFYFCLRIVTLFQCDYATIIIGANNTMQRQFKRCSIKRKKNRKLPGYWCTLEQSPNTWNGGGGGEGKHAALLRIMYCELFSVCACLCPIIFCVESFSELWENYYCNIIELTITIVAKQKKSHLTNQAKKIYVNQSTSKKVHWEWLRMTRFYFCFQRVFKLN